MYPLPEGGPRLEPQSLQCVALPGCGLGAGAAPSTARRFERRPRIRLVRLIVLAYPAPRRVTRRPASMLREARATQPKGDMRRRSGRRTSRKLIGRSSRRACRPPDRAGIVVTEHRSGEPEHEVVRLAPVRLHRSRSTISEFRHATEPARLGEALHGQRQIAGPAMTIPQHEPTPLQRDDRPRRMELL